MILSSYKLVEPYVSGRGARLAAFAKAVCVYFLLCGGGGGGTGGGPGAAAAAAKCAPVLCLVLTVLAHRADTPKHCKERRRYALLVSAGLALSAAGDALLVWPARLTHGMAAFGAAHLAYCGAFGWRPLRPLAAAPILLAIAGYLQVVRGPGAFRYLVPAYALLLGAMAWRACVYAARARSTPSAARAPAAAGALLFLVSDAALGYDMFRAPLPYAQVIVMSTYYLAQLCIALSALQGDPPASASAPAHASAPARRQLLSDKSE